MTTQITTVPVSNDGEVRMREKKGAASKQNGSIRNGDTNLSSTSAVVSPTDETSSDATTTSPRSQASTFEQAFFFGLTIDEALNSNENLSELFYNACKYNHLELIKRCIEENRVNVNEPFNNDYALCIAR